MSPGKKRRLERIFQKDKKTVIVPMDHGVSIGPIKGIQNMQIIVDKIVTGGVDALVVHKGIAKRTIVGTIGLIVHLSASSNLSPNFNNKVQVCSVKEAVQLGADAVSVHINVGAQDEDRMLSLMGSVASECEIFGVPLLAMMYPRGPKISNEHAAEFVAHAARLGDELGADIVKTNYTGDIESFKTVVESCQVPVVIAGGPKAKTVEDILQMTHESVQAGGAGISIGRNVFQHEKPALMVKALSEIVHNNVSVSSALNILRGSN